MPIDIPASLKALPLEHIIGGPLEAAVKAQAMAARTTVEFIQAVGLNRLPSGELKAVTVEFDFDRTVEETIQLPPATAGAAPPAPVRNFRIIPSKLTVPLLAIVDPPAFRIDDMSIDFEYQIHDVETSESSTELGVQAKVEAQYWFIKAEVSGSYSNKTANRRETDQRTTLRITVHASQKDIPEGLSRVLDMLHDQLQVVPLSSGTLAPTPTARLDTVSPLLLSKAVTGAQTVNVRGSGLVGGSRAEVDDATITPVALVNAPLSPPSGATDVTSASVQLTLGTATATGEKTLSIVTPQGRAETRFAVMA